MFVPVIAVAGVQVAVVEVVDVVSVGDRSVSAARSVLMFVRPVLHAIGDRALVPVVVVLVMTMAVVDVVDVIAVHHGDVTAIGAVHVRVTVVPVIVGLVILEAMRPVHEHSLALGPMTVWNVDVPSAIDRLLDATVVGGFSRLGYEVRSRRSDWETFPPSVLKGRRIVVTGPTSGIGRALVGQLAALSADLVLVGRDETRLRRVASELGTDPRVVVADMSDLEAVRSACDTIAAIGEIDTVVHNAGALLHDLMRTPQGHETTIATHVLAPHLVTRRLPSARTIWVASGGMYAASLIDPDRHDPMNPSAYDGTRQYALAKRLQVTLVEEWARRHPERFVASMHPGWADTPGVRSSLPGFARITSPVLRSADQGADTITWLCATTRDVPSGRFWCDREVRPIHRLPQSRRSDTPQRRDSVWAWVERLTDGRS